MKKFAIAGAVLAVAVLVGYTGTTYILNNNSNLGAEINKASVDAQKRNAETPITVNDQNRGFKPAVAVPIPGLSKEAYAGFSYNKEWSPEDISCPAEQRKLDGINYQLKQLSQKPKTDATEKVRLSLEKDKKIAEKALLECKKKVKTPVANASGSIPTTQSVNQPVTNNIRD